MEISVREAATLLGRSRRTVRAQLTRGELAGRKRGGRWRIDRRQLPLSEAQHRALQRRADDVRAAVEDALPSRLARSTGDRSRSVFDLDAFRLGAAVLRELRTDSGFPGEQLPRITAALERGLLDLSEAALQFDRGAKRDALRRCRARMAEAVGLLLLGTGDSATQSRAADWVGRLEKDMLPAIAGFARWIDRLQERRP